MSSPCDHKEEEQRNTITIQRVLNLTPDMVWKAWTQPALLKKWWGPQEYTSPYWSNDLQVGGKYLACMRGADGKDLWTTGIYTDIIAQKKLVFTDSFADSQGNVVDASYYKMPDMQPELLITVTLEEIAGKTNITLQHAGMPASVADDCIKGWQSSFDKMELNMQQYSLN